MIPTPAAPTTSAAPAQMTVPRPPSTPLTSAPTARPAPVAKPSQTAGRNNYAAPLPPKATKVDSDRPERPAPLDAAKLNRRDEEPDDIEVEGDTDGLGTPDPKDVRRGTTRKAKESKAGDAVVEETETKPEPEAKPDDNPFDVDALAKKETPADEPEAPAAGEQPASKRDYSKVPPEFLPIAKKLPNKEFALAMQLFPAIAEKAKRVDELEAKLKDSGPKFMYESADAYVLDPQYRQLTTQAQQASFEEQHYVDQLEKIKSGEPWAEITHYDANMRPQYKIHNAPENGIKDVRAEIQLTQALSQISQLRAQAQNQVSQLAQSYKSRREGALGELTALESKVFDKIKEDTFTPEDKSAWAKADELVPAVFKDHPMTRFSKKMFVGYMRLFNAHKATLAELEKHTKIKTAKSLAGTNPRPGSVGKEPEVVNFEEFES